MCIDDIKKLDPEIVAKRFALVMFGVNSSPFLLLVTILFHMTQYENVHPKVIWQFLQDLYMDDSTSGAQSIQGSYEFYLYNKILMQKGGFPLLKWTTNDKYLQNKIDDKWN